MFLNLYKYNLLRLYRDKLTLFWNLFFPIILCTFFSITFAGLLSSEVVIKSDIAIIEDSQIPKAFYEAIDESNMFNYTIVDEIKAKEMLGNGEIFAYLIYSDKQQNKSNISLYVNQNGMNQTITKMFMDTYTQTVTTINDVISSNPQAITKIDFENLNLFKENIENVSVGNSTNLVVIYYYGTIAMSCMMSCYGGVGTAINIQANQSEVAKRQSASSSKKVKAFIATALANIINSLLSMALLIIYLIFIAKIEFGTSILMLCLVITLGIFTGFSIGLFIGVIIKKSFVIKQIICQIITILGGFLGGMMLPGIKYLIHTNAPIIEKINPASLITDSLYMLYYYNSYDKVIINLLVMLIITIIFSILSFTIIRKQRYNAL